LLQAYCIQNWGVQEAVWNEQAKKRMAVQYIYMKNKRIKNTETLNFYLLFMANFKTNAFGEDRKRS